MLLCLLSTVFAWSQSLRHDKQRTSCWKHCWVVPRVHACTWKLTSSGLRRLCERQLSQVLLVGITDFRCWLHLQCLAGAARIAETNRAQCPLSTEADAESEHGGAAFVTCIRRTLEPGVDGQHTPYTWKRECASRLLESRRFIQMFMDTQRKTSFLPPVAKACEKARLSRMNEELICQGTRSSRTGVGTLQFPLNSFDSVFRQPQNCKRVCCELTGNAI